MKYQISKGFTLIEVLISSVILFSALAITAELYMSSQTSSNKAIAKALHAQISSIAISAIKTDLRRLAENKRINEHSGEFSISGIRYSWNANREKFSSRVKNIDEIYPPSPQFSLFNVTVTAQFNVLKPVNFSFKVATW